MSTIIQRSLASGEIAPALWPRTDTSKYAAGLRTLRNAIVQRTGGATVRPGTVIDAAIKDSTLPVRLIEFIFNATQTYVLEFGNGYVRFHQNGAPVRVSGVPAFDIFTNYVGPVYAAAGVSPTATSAGEIVSHGGVNYLAIASSQGATPPDSQFWYPLTADIYELPSPFQTADLAAIRFTQSSDIVTLTHPNYFPQELSRFGQTAWTLGPPFFQSQQPNPGNLASDQSHSGPVETAWIVTAIDATTNEETDHYTPYPDTTFPLFNGAAKASTTPSSGSPATLTWNAVTNAAYYKVYRALESAGGIYGLIGTTSLTQFLDTGDTVLPADYTTQPITNYNPFPGAGDYPSACCYYQQRLFYSNTTNNPNRTYASQIGLFNNMNSNLPTIDSDFLSFAMAGRRDSIQHLIDMGKLILFTSGSEQAIVGDQNNAITPSAINPQLQTAHGSSSLRPLLVGDSAVYNQARGSVVRDLTWNFQVDGYRGDDLTTFATHLFDGYTLVDWGYQQIPNPVIWAVRSDGILLAMTYVKEQQILAWSHCDFQGTVENVCVVPEGNQDAVYLVVKRKINGSTTRYIERMSNAFISSAVDYIGMDCASTYDGRNSTGDTATLSGGTTWGETELLTLTLSANNFASILSGDPGHENQIWLTGADGSICRFTIQNVTSSLVATGLVDRTVPTSLRSTATSTWSKAVTNISGLGYIEGQNVSVFADGYVVASPNNAAYPVLTVSSGAIVLPKPRAVAHVGLPYIADIETLDIDTPSAMGTITDKLKYVGSVTLHLLNSAGIWMGGSNPDSNLRNTGGNPLFGLTELKLRQYEGYESAVSLKTGKVTQSILGGWDQNGHVFIRQVDPVPMTVLAIAPDGLFPIEGGR